MRTQHLKLLSFNKIVCRTTSGEFEWYQKLYNHFVSLKLDVEVLHNEDLFSNCGNFYPEARSLEYLNVARSLKELSITKVCEHLLLDDEELCRKDNDFSTIKTSVTLDIKIIEDALYRSCNISGCTAPILIVNNLDPDSFEVQLGSIEQFVSIRVTCQSR